MDNGRSKGLGKIHDLCGKKYGRLIVTSDFKRRRVGKDSHIVVDWLCRCECGNEKWIQAGHLRRKSGKTVSCGCFQLESRKIKRGLAAKRALYSNYKNMARRRKLKFKLDFDQFIELANCNCFYCGNRPNQIFKNVYGNGDFIYNGIDRRDNNKGYLIENCVASCKRCNAAKSDMTFDEFIKLVNRIYVRHIL